MRTILKVTSKNGEVISLDCNLNIIDCNKTFTTSPKCLATLFTVYSLRQLLTQDLNPFAFNKVTQAINN